MKYVLPGHKSILFASIILRESVASGGETLKQ